MPAKINDGLTNQQRYHAKPEKRAHRNALGKAWRQTDKGKFIRNRNHWIAAGVKEPNEGWETYWETFKDVKRCEVCDVKFDLDGGPSRSNGRCLDHHHASGSIRQIICRKCNTSCVRMFDDRMMFVLLDLHRYFRLNDV